MNRQHDSGIMEFSSCSSTDYRTSTAISSDDDSSSSDSNSSTTPSCLRDSSCSFYDDLTASMAVQPGTPLKSGELERWSDSSSSEEEKEDHLVCVVDENPLAEENKSIAHKVVEAVHPQTIKPKNHGDIITPQTVKVMMAPAIYHPSRFYLATTDDWPKKVDAFDRKMSDSYSKLSDGPERQDWKANKENLGVGSVVAICREAEEWARAKIVKIDDSMPLGRGKCTLFLIDLGMYVEEDLANLYILQKEFAEQRPFIVRCRVKLSWFYAKHHEGREKWSKEVTLAFFTCLKDQKVQVKFLKKVTRKNREPVWEVSLEKFLHPHPLFNPVPRRPIQEQVIKMAMGEYKEDYGIEDSSSSEGTLYE